MAPPLTDPPSGWHAMVELMAVSPGAEPEAPAERPGFFARLFMSPVGRARVSAEADIERLGLSTEQHAEERYRADRSVPDLVGPTVMRGERLGRAVEVRVDGDRYRVRLAASVPELHVRSEDGRLVASERSPAEVHEALAALAPDKRWRGVEVKGGADGITVFHRFDGGRSSEQGWLDDLWLAEGLAERLARP